MDRVENQAENFNQQLAEFIDGSPTPFHAVANLVSLFREAGFQAFERISTTGHSKSGRKVLCHPQWLINYCLCRR